MPTYQIEMNGQKFEVEAPDENALKSVISKLSQPKAADPRDSIMGKVDAAVRGAADTLTFGMADEFSAGMDALANPILGTGENGESLSDRYNANVAKQRGIDESDYNDRFGYRLGGQITGGLTQGVGLAKNGLSLTGNAIQAGKSLPKVMMLGGVEGAALGAANGLGSGEDMGDRIDRAAIGGATGLALGAATPAVVAGASKLLSPVVQPIASRLFPERYAQNAVGTALRRSGKSVDDIVAGLDDARLDGQDMFNVADSMGNSGQRMLSTAVRTPNDARQSVVEALQTRQTGQGDRLAQFLADGFDAPDTAAQRVASLTADRKLLADVNYPNSRATATAVDVGGAVREIDDVLKPGAQKLMNPGTGLAGDSTDALLSKYRARMTNGNEQLTDFDEVLKLKSEIGDEIERLVRTGEKWKASQLQNVSKRLDSALEAASPDYRAANDAFRAQSKTIEAVEAGTNATAGRVRSADSIEAFNKMQPGEQSAFRAGYADPLIAKIENSPLSATTNKARTLISPKTSEEFPAFAIPQRADKMGRRIVREQTMFDTANAALGGSKTADNLADAADMNQFDPSVIRSLVRRDIGGALASGIQRLAGESNGMSPGVVERVAKALMETNPEAARSILTGGLDKLSKSDKMRAMIVQALMSSGTASPARLAP